MRFIVKQYFSLPTSNEFYNSRSLNNCEAVVYIHHGKLEKHS